MKKSEFFHFLKSMFFNYFKVCIHFDSKIKESVLFRNLKRILWTLSLEKIAEEQQLFSDPLEN